MKRNKKNKIEITGIQTKAPIVGMRTIPDMCYDPIMVGAFLGLVRFALTKPDFILQFEKYSKKKFKPTLIPEFADWVNTHLWGGI